MGFACSFTGLAQFNMLGSANLLSKQVQRESDVPKYCMFFSVVRTSSAFSSGVSMYIVIGPL